MRTRWFVLAAGPVLAGTMTFAPAMAQFVEWSGPGYYIEDSGDFLFGGFTAGPFSSETDCKAALAALSQDEQQDAACTYYASNPDKG